MTKKAKKVVEKADKPELTKVKALQTVSLFGGLVGVDEAQLNDRSHNLKETEVEGVYEVVKPIMFKVGEVFSVSDFNEKLGNIKAE